MFHEYQGKRPGMVHMSLQSQAFEQPALRYDLPPNAIRIRNPMYNDFAYGSPTPTDLKGYGGGGQDSLDSFQRQYDSKKNIYGGGQQVILLNQDR